MIEHQERPFQNLVLNIVLNIILPTTILIKFSGEDALGVRNGVIVALCFPIGYGIYDFIKAKKINFFSALGVISVLLTGGISLLGLDPLYLAIKEAAIPGLIGIATIASLFTKYPLFRSIIYKSKLFNLDGIEEALAKYGTREKFESSLTKATMILSGSFFLSSFLNFVLARYIVVSSPGTEEYNAELGRLTALSYPIIAIPSMIIMMYCFYYLYRSLTELTHMKLEEIVILPDEEEEKKHTQEES